MDLESREPAVNGKRPAYMAPEWVTKLSRDERLRYYSDKARRELPAYDLLDEIQSDLSDEDLTEALRAVRHEIMRVEAALKLFQSEKFLELRQAQVEIVGKIKQNWSQQAVIRTRVFHKRADQHQLHELSILSSVGEDLKRTGVAIETEITTLCESAGGDPSEYMMLDKLFGNRGQIEDLLEKLRANRESLQGA